MAARGSAKWHSVKQEEFIAALYDGVRSASSGAAEHDSGDVRCEHVLIECKVRVPTVKPKPLPKFAQDLEKVAQEAYESGKTPVLSLRYHAPDSILAGPDGFVDLSVRLACDDAEREIAYVDAKIESDEEQAGQE